MRNAGKVRIRLPVAVTLSHVTRQWRESVINAPLLWSNIRVTTSLGLDALRATISRSGECELDVSFLSSPSHLTRNRRLRDSLHLRESASLLTPHISRWRRLCIVADSRSMQYIMHPIIHVLFTRLQCMELGLIRQGQAPTLRFGPLHFNPHVFTTLHLHQVTIHPIHPSHFSGLRSLQLSQTPSSIIDQVHLTSTVPIIPISSNALLMSHVTNLTISTPFPSLPVFLSVNPANLTIIELSNFRCTSPLQYTALINLFSVLITQGLEELLLAGFDDGAWDAFLEFLGRAGSSLLVVHGNEPMFPNLKRLTLQSLAVRGFGQRFTDAIPEIRYRYLVSALLHDDKIKQLFWPEIRVLVNGSEIATTG